MTEVQTCEVDGVTYCRSNNVTTDGGACTGCAAQHDEKLCKKLDYCYNNGDFIWLKQELVP